MIYIFLFFCYKASNRMSIVLGYGIVLSDEDPQRINKLLNLSPDAGTHEICLELNSRIKEKLGAEYPSLPTEIFGNAAHTRDGSFISLKHHSIYSYSKDSITLDETRPGVFQMQVDDAHIEAVRMFKELTHLNTKWQWHLVSDCS
jgi:hypothetical protein